MENKSPDSDKPTGLSPLRALRTVLSAFIGIRRGGDSRDDLARLTPVQIIVTALCCVALLITLLVVLVKHITS